MKKMAAGKFKVHCLAIMDEVQSKREAVLITKRGKPVAKLVRVTEPEARHPRWNLDAHRRWIKKIFGRKVFPNSDERLAAARADRKLT